MILMRTNGLQITGGNYPVEPGSSEVYVAEPIGQPPSTQNSGAAAAGKMSIAVGLGEMLSQWNIPNAVDYVEGIWGSFTNNNKLVDKFDSEFRTLGNGKFELQDVLGFPVNWGVKVLDYFHILPRPNKDESFTKTELNGDDNNNKKPNNNNGNNGSGSKPNKDNKGGTGHAR